MYKDPKKWASACSNEGNVVHMDSKVCRVRSALLQTATEGTQPLDSNALAMAWASLVPWGVMALSWSLPD